MVSNLLISKVNSLRTLIGTCNAVLLDFWQGHFNVGCHVLKMIGLILMSLPRNGKEGAAHHWGTM
jgi:hypothetical protein